MNDVSLQPRKRNHLLIYMCKQSKMETKMVKRQILLISLIALVGGCTVNGHDEFSCPNPENGVCMPADQAYIAAEQGKDANDFRGKGDAKKEGESSTTVRSEYSDVAPVVGLMSQPIRQPKPVLMPASVLLAWVNQYEDENGVFHMPQSAFVEITPRRWSLSDPAVSKYKSISPFKMVKSITNSNQTSDEGK